MIHFDFIVSDEDAYNILRALHSEECYAQEKLLELCNSNDATSCAMKVAYSRQIHYFKELAEKMHNYKV